MASDHDKTPEPSTSGLLPIGDEGRDEAGRFAKGNKLSKGNPHAKRVARVRAAVMRGTDPEKVKRAVAKLLDQAVEGDRLALETLLDRVLGKPATEDLTRRLDELERMLEELTERGR